jgi:hypothetical protein
MAPQTVEDVRRHLLLATKVELSTIPPYLFAMYSIKDQESDAARLIASVVVEEMLHACLATNLLLAVGGEPDFGPDTIPSYPSLMAHHTPDLLLSLVRCTPELIRGAFMEIESPRAPGAPPEDDEYETLGQFYAALENAITNLDPSAQAFAEPQAHRQLADPSFYSPVKFDAEDSGGLMLIDSPATADHALEIIIDQGEGLSDHLWADPAHQELTHFHKFKQIADGASPIGHVWPVMSDPSTTAFPEFVRPLSNAFNALYSLIYITMGDLFSGKHDQGERIGRLYTLMSGVLPHVARQLVQTPVGDGQNACPTFEVYRFTSDPWSQAADLMEATAAAHPDLVGPAASVRGLV